MRSRGKGDFEECVDGLSLKEERKYLLMSNEERAKALSCQVAKVPSLWIMASFLFAVIYA